MADHGASSQEAAPCPRADHSKSKSESVRAHGMSSSEIARSGSNLSDHFEGFCRLCLKDSNDKCSVDQIEDRYYEYCCRHSPPLPPIRGDRPDLTIMKQLKRSFSKGAHEQFYQLCIIPHSKRMKTNVEVTMFPILSLSLTCQGCLYQPP